MWMEPNYMQFSKMECGMSENEAFRCLVVLFNMKQLDLAIIIYIDEILWMVIYTRKLNKSKTVLKSRIQMSDTGNIM